MRETIYLDYNATTPLDSGVRNAMLPFIDNIYGNPSSIHRIGRQARCKLDQFRESVSSVWRCKPSEVIFTSGGTESNNLAIFGASRRLQDKGRHLITSSIEHHSVLHCFQYLEYHEKFELTLLPADSSGMVSVEELKQAIRPDTILVSVMAANNETGSIQPVAEIGAVCRERGVCFHTDASQWFGKQPFANIEQFNADLVTACAHKFYGPKGAGALYVRSPFPMNSILLGGGQENEKRAGTENMASIAGLAYAVEHFIRNPVFPEDSLRFLTGELINKMEKIDGVVFRGHRTKRLSNTVAFTVNACDSLGLVAGLDLENICASSGSACSSGSLQTSHVLESMGLSRTEAGTMLRFSLGRETTSAEVEAAATALPVVIKRIRTLS